MAKRFRRASAFWPLKPPSPGDDEQARQVQLFFRAIVAVMLVASIFLSTMILVQPGVAVRALIALSVVNGLGLASLWLNQAGYPRAAGWLFVGGLIALISVNSLQQGGIYSPGIQSFFVFVLMASLFLGERQGVYVALACASISLGLVIADATGTLPDQTVRYRPFATWLLLALYLGIIVLLARWWSRAVHASLARAESELSERRRAEQRLEQAMEAGSIGLWEQDPVSKDFVGSARAFQVIGSETPPSQMLAFAQWRRMVHPDDLPAVETALEALHRGSRRERMRYRISGSDGSLRQVDVAASAELSQDGEVARIIGMVVDRTEQWRTELERERLLQALSERIKELQLLHAATRLLQGSRPFDRSILEDLVRIMPSAWTHSGSCEARICAGGLEATTPGWRETPWRLSHTFATSVGKGVVEVEYLQEFPAADEGPFVAEEREVLASLADILVAYLERAQAELRRRTLEAQLRQSQKLEALGTLAGGIAHDFNNILSAIGGYLELAMLELPAESRARGYLENVSRANVRAEDLVKRILLFSRRQQSDPKVMSLVSVVEEVLSLLGANLPGNVLVHTEFRGEPREIVADASQIHQVILNLVTNAVHAMKTGGGRLEITVEDVVIGEVAAGPLVDLKPGAHVLLTVRDTGAGMSREVMDRLFEPFFTTKGQQGTGLGLSIVHGIVKEHGGVISVESEIGRGTSFQIHFPAAVAESSDGTAEADAVSRGRGEHVMYVDDDEALVYLMRRVVERLGYRFSGFVDASVALQAFREDPGEFDLVITDLSMPGLTGLEVVREIRRIRPDVPVVLTSGYGGAFPGGLDLIGVRGTLRKPASTADIGRLLSELLR